MGVEKLLLAKFAKNKIALGCSTVSRFLRGLAGQGHEAGDGSSDAGAQDRGHYFDTLE